MIDTGRVSGILLPLFSLRTRGDFGIGDFGGLDPLFRWMEAAHQRVLMLLPLLPTAPNDPSPYATRCAFGLNPLFIDLHAVPEFVEGGGINGFSSDARSRLEEARAAKRIRYDLVFPLKRSALRAAFERFDRNEWSKDGGRARDFKRYLDEQKGWLDSYALFTAISQHRNLQAWWEWPEPLKSREPQALEAEREKLGTEIRFIAWQQWVAEEQWKQVRAQAQARKVMLCGDEPFIIGQDGADTWANPKLLRRDARLGVPPDPFSATGQDWGLPYFDFEAMEREQYAWLRFRAAKAASYYDLRRVDHAVGYFRQWIRDAETPNGRFFPGDEPRQRELGERHFGLLSDNAGIVAEDLGVIPDFVREILGRMGIPGYRVMRWERDDGRYRNPHQYPSRSLATTGTHDTDTLREWWETAQPWEREAMAGVYPEMKGMQGLTAEFTPQVHEVLLRACENSGSDLVVLPWQDVLGTRDRINLPGSTGDANWSYRIEQTAEELLQRDETRRAAELMARLSQQAGR